VSALEKAANVWIEGAVEGEGERIKHEQFQLYAYRDIDPNHNLTFMADVIYA
jgi:hypothetical protein